MANYHGCTCVACRTRFVPEDDVVVCPVCGTPYHRDCWNAHGHCIQTELHESGGTWVPDREEPLEEQSEGTVQGTVRQKVTCPSCGAENDETNLFCMQCGETLRHAEPASGAASEPLRDLFPEEDGMDDAEADDDGESMHDLMDYVCTNTGYYRPRFRYFRTQKRKFAPSFVGMLVPELYFAYRKMWVLSLVVIALLTLLDIPGMLVTMVSQSDTLIAMFQEEFSGMGSLYAGMSEHVTSNLNHFADAMQPYANSLNWIQVICDYLKLVIRVLGFVFANYLYYRHTCKQVRQVYADEATLVDISSRLRRKGGTSIGLLIGMLAIKYVLLVLVTMGLVLGILF